MITVREKTINDLEFRKVTSIVQQYCTTELGKQAAGQLSVFEDFQQCQIALTETSEYLSSFSNENVIPNHGFEPINKELQLLQIENSIIEIKGFRTIMSLCNTVITHQKALNKFKTYYPTLFGLAQQLSIISSIPKDINEIIDRFGEIRDKASDELFTIRKALSQVRQKINQSFSSSLNHYLALDYLDDIKESVVENKRVLAVKAMYRRKIQGAVIGASKTGSIVYMLPEATAKSIRELDNLLYDEKEEIKRILKNLTDSLRPYAEILLSYQEYLTHIDLTSAKALYAQEINAILPTINEEKKLVLRDAYHPLLLQQNQEKGLKTWPQTIELNENNRIIVISGPNAGGKSITLKTIGLLQLMIQSGILIPVHERSTLCFFEKILTDIGDNQSIENHLSTYSYRLKNMNYFLKKCDAQTLFLIDEFGTGSDPELGGALAESFLDVFYEKRAFGLITTHYSNLKLLANELDHASNANMLFDNKTLEPTFQLVVGQAGSSFTFEVAQKNGIPYSIINKAKKKIERGKVRFDATIAKLQRERSKFEKTGNRLLEQEQKATDESKKLEKLNSRIKEKLENYQMMYDQHKRMIQLGSKVDELAERFFIDQKKRPLISGLLRIVETENSKKKQKSAKEAKTELNKKIEISKELAVKAENIKKEKQKTKKTVSSKPKKPVQVELKIGDTVKLEDGKASGQIENIEKGIASVNYGLFVTKVQIDQLIFVKRDK